MWEVQQVTIHDSGLVQLALRSGSSNSRASQILELFDDKLDIVLSGHSVGGPFHLSENSVQVCPFITHKRTLSITKARIEVD